MKAMILTGVMLMTAICGYSQTTITVKNTTNVQRQELIDVEYGDICKSLVISNNEPIVITNAIGQEVDYQITSDGKLLIDASVVPNGTTTFTVNKGVPEAMKHYSTLPTRTKAGGLGVGKAWVRGRLYPDRLDDIAWENDRGAYRVYGPAFQKSGSVGYGPDVWVKNTPELDVDSRFRMDIDIKPTQQQLIDAGYKKEADALLQANSFHIDHGTGNDCYAVGATLGCGAPAIISKGDIVYPYAWQQYDILDNGPLRFTVSLTFGDTIINKEHVTEHRIISLDKGSNFNRVEVWYETIGKKALTVCSGFPLHQPNEGTLVLGKDFAQYADPTDAPQTNNCELYIGCLYPNGNVETKKEFNHAVGVTTLKPNEHWIYYAGTAWSKYDVRNQQEWQCRINTTLNALKNPLTVTFK